MKAVVQRVSRASVIVKGRTVGKIGQGLVVLLGIAQQDCQNQVDWLAEKILNLRIFSDKTDKMNLSVKDVSGSVLVVSQFTIYADTRKGNRPSFVRAAKPSVAEKLYNLFVKKMRSKDVTVETGRFGVMMKLHLVNDGPVTVIVEK